MSFIDRRNLSRPSSGAAPFEIEEVFFSRTDERGVIQAGNYTFQRVSGFDWEELIGAPHKIIRHPDMPRAVFWLLWERITAGKHVGAYVKNRAKDGLYYWVYAVVAPCEGGYLSARIKPTSELRALIEQEYATLRKAELEEDLAPEESAARLIARLGALGYPDVNEFCATALGHELQARAAGCGRAAPRQIAHLDEMQTASARLREETESLVSEFNAMRTIPHNMQVIASRTEPTGGPISTLSKNYAAISSEMSDWFAGNVIGPESNFASIRASVNSWLLAEGLVEMLAVCDRQIHEERRRLDQINVDKESRILNALRTQYADAARQARAVVTAEAGRIRDACETMNRHLLGLSTTRVLCKIESARLAVAGSGLDDIIAQLKDFQERIGTQLEEITRLSTRILDLTDSAGPAPPGGLPHPSLTPASSKLAMPE